MQPKSKKQSIHLNILGIGTYIPKKVRANNWWSKEIVERWKSERNTIDSTTDPFAGAVERRVIGQNESAASMELQAASEAMDKANIKKSEISFLFENSLVPDYLGVNHACIIHEKLGLNDSCFTLETNGGCNSFMMQLALARNLIESGAANYGLLVSSSAATRVLKQESHTSIHFGDGASAVIVGRGTSRQLLSQSIRTNGKYHRSIIMNVSGKNWWNEGAIYATIGDFDIAQEMITNTNSMAKEVIEDALIQCNRSKEEVDFFACHQPTSFFQEEIRQFCGLRNAKTLDHYTETGTMSAVNLPYLLKKAEQTKALKKGDLVVMYQTGAGLNYAATAMIW